MKEKLWLTKQPAELKTAKNLRPRVQTQSAARRRQAVLRSFMLGGGGVGSAPSHSWAGSALRLWGGP